MSRNRKDIVSIFDVFCEVGANGDGSNAVILQKYPEDFNHAQTLKSIAQFTFPCGVDDDDVETVQLFSFVLTDEKSQYTYAFCRHTPRNNTCICILSGLPWASTFYKILNRISTIMNNEPVHALESFLIRTYHTSIPSPGEVLVIPSEYESSDFEVQISDSSKLPTLKEDKFMLEFYNAVPEKQMIALYASLLKERRILFTGRKLSQLSSCIFAAARLLYPMHWQSLFIPVLPIGLVDMLMAPMPYLIGVTKKTLKLVKVAELGDVMIIDLEQHILQCTHNDVADLPTEAVSLLQHQLHAAADMFISDSLARAFLRTNVHLFGGYRKGLSCSSYTYSWDRQKFIQSQKPGLQPYLRSLLGQDGVQYLERFIDERLAALNSGTPFDDEFESEIRLAEEKISKAQFIKERLGRLNPKEIRRISMKKANNDDPPILMSFDTKQWTTEVEEPTQSAQEPDVCDLIDLNQEPTTTTASSSSSLPLQSHSAPKFDYLISTPHQSIKTASEKPDPPPSRARKGDESLASQMQRWQRFD